MLQTMRELAKSWIFKSLMGLLVVSFGIWGIGDMFRGNPATRTVAQVGKLKVPVQLLEVRFQAELPKAREAFGPDLTAEQARQVGVLDRTLRVIMEEYSFDQESARLGLNVSHDYILRRLAQEPSLKDEKGNFNEELWRRIVGKSGLSEQMFFDLERKSAARQIIFSALTSNIKPSKLMIDNLYQARGDKRVLEVLTLRNDSLKSALPQATDDVLETYYKEHESNFVAPEYRAITVARLSGEAIKKDVLVSDEELQETYTARKQELNKLETRDLVQVILGNEEKASEIAKSAQAAKDLTAAAKSKNMTPVTMTGISERTVAPELYTSVFALTEGQVSQPIKTALGWHVIQVKKIHAGGTPTFDEIKGELRTAIQEERAGDVIAKTVNQLDDALASGKPIEEVAETLKLHLTRFAALDQSGRGMDEKEIKDLPAKDLVLQAAFSLGANESSQVLDDGQGNYYVARVDQITPSQTRPFADVKNQVLTAWMSDKLAEKASEEAETIAKALREGKKATSFASRPGIEVKLSKPISRLGEVDPSLPEMAVAQALQMNKGDVATATAPGKQLVISLVDIVPVDPQKPESSRLKVVDDLSEKLPHNLVDEYSTQLHEHFPVSINEDLFASLKNRSTQSN